MQVEDMPTANDVAIFGDAAKPGTYLVRKRIAANQTVRPHYDDQDRWVTVLKGTLWIGKGDVFKPDALAPVREGGVAYLPANTHYFEMAGESDVLLDVTPVRAAEDVHQVVSRIQERASAILAAKPTDGSVPDGVTLVEVLVEDVADGLEVVTDPDRLDPLPSRDGTAHQRCP